MRRLQKSEWRSGMVLSVVALAPASPSAPAGNFEMAPALPSAPAGNFVMAQVLKTPEL
jgi:hypothetical protein